MPAQNLAQDLFALSSRLRDAGIIFAYCGYVTEPVLAGVGDALKQKLLVEDLDTKTARSVFAVFVEQMQNIIRYSADSEGQRSGSPAEQAQSAELKFGIMTVSRAGETYVVRAGNLVEKGDAERLRLKLERIRSADKNELKAMYKETLKADPIEGSKGAGVGFIEIARRASTPIAFDFTGVDEHYVFFALEAEI